MAMNISSAQRKVVKNLRYYDEKKLHFGFTVGLNYMDFAIHQNEQFLNSDSVYSIENAITPGFNLGPIVSYTLGDYFDARALVILTFGQRDLIYKRLEDTTVTVNSRDDIPEHTMKIESTFIEMPLLMKYKSKRINNYRPYLIGGGVIKYDLAAQKKIKEDEGDKIRLNPIDYYYQIGFGIDFYLPYFKLSTELSYSVGLTNIVNYDNTAYTRTIDRMNSKVIMLSFHFEGSI